MSAPPRWLAARFSRRRASTGVWLLLAVLLLHGLLLVALLPGGDPAAGVAAPPQPVAGGPRVSSTRAVPPPAAVPIEAAAGTTADRLAPTQRRAAAARSAPAAAAPNPPAPAAVADAATLPAEPSAPAAQDAAWAPSTVDSTVPVYANQVPASASLHYQLQRGAVVGHAQLVWQRRDDDYELSLEGDLMGMPVLGSVSRGTIDADGVAPLRLAERRRSRELRAANFQRDSQRITFSGPQTEYPLRPGAQDRLSWMIQLPAIVEADAALTQPDARVTLFVVGTRGDAEAWHFEVQGREALELPAGAVADALHLLREPRRPYDTRVEVWLDLARHYLPVRVLLGTVPGGQPLELKLSRLSPAPL
ncbi:MAG TPA: DUF3108 domain-containing protein [Rubrivivax sp.]|nr:DUF3108 domain-containing protein [Rubrivivax sp.]